MKFGHAASFILSLATLTFSSASAEEWLKIDPNDPYSNDGSFHLFDIDSAFEDRATGLVAANMTYLPPATAASGGATSQWLWAFDCVADTVYYVATTTPAEGWSVTTDWRSHANSLAEPVMGGVTNMFGRKLCALKGSWPMEDLP